MSRCLTVENKTEDTIGGSDLKRNFGPRQHGSENRAKGKKNPKCKHARRSRDILRVMLDKLGIAMCDKI